MASHSVCYLVWFGSCSWMDTIAIANIQHQHQSEKKLQWFWIVRFFNFYSYAPANFTFILLCGDGLEKFHINFWHAICMLFGKTRMHVPNRTRLASIHHNIKKNAKITNWIVCDKCFEIKHNLPNVLLIALFSRWMRLLLFGYRG